MSQHTTNRMRHLAAGTLLVQADATDWQAALDCSDRPYGGLVLTGDDRMLDVAKQLLRHDHYGRPILVDRARYTGTATRKLAEQPFDRGWIDRQRDVGLARRRVSHHGPGGDADAGVKTSRGLPADVDAFLACQAEG